MSSKDLQSVDACLSSAQAVAAGGNKTNRVGGHVPSCASISFDATWNMDATVTDQQSEGETQKILRLDRGTAQTVIPVIPVILPALAV